MARTACTEARWGASGGRWRLQAKSLRGPLLLVERPQAASCNFSRQTRAKRMSRIFSSWGDWGKLSCTKQWDFSKVESHHTECIRSTIAMKGFRCGLDATGFCSKKAAKGIARSRAILPTNPLSSFGYWAAAAGSGRATNLLMTSVTPSQYFPSRSAAFIAAADTVVGQAVGSVPAKALCKFAQLSARRRCFPLSFPWRFDASCWTK